MACFMTMTGTLMISSRWRLLQHALETAAMFLCLTEKELELLLVSSLFAFWRAAVLLGVGRCGCPHAVGGGENGVRVSQCGVEAGGFRW